MKKVMLAILLAAMLFSMSVVSAESTPAGAYWQEMKTIYEEWKALDSESVAIVTVALPDEPEKTFRINMISKSDMTDFISWNQLTIESDELEIPVIEMYTSGTDIYVNTEAALFFAEIMGIGEAAAIEEAYVMFQNNDMEMNLDTNFLMQVLEFVEGMELDFELNMTLEDGTYTLSLDSDEMISMLDTYMKYVMANMGRLAEITGQDELMELTDEEVAEAMAAYDQMAGPMLQMAREAITGSYYNQITTFEEDGYEESAEFYLTTPFGELTLAMETTALRLEGADIQLPTSVKVFTEDDLTSLMFGGMGVTVEEQQLAAIIDPREGRYVRFEGIDVVEGEIEVVISPEGRSYMRTADAVALFGLEMEPVEEMMQIRELEQHGYGVVWNEANRFIEIHH